MQVESQGAIKHETHVMVRSYDLFLKVQRKVKRKAA